MQLKKSKISKKKFLEFFYPLGFFGYTPISRLRGKNSKIALMTQKVFPLWPSMPNFKSLALLVWAVGGGVEKWHIASFKPSEPVEMMTHQWMLTRSYPEKYVHSSHHRQEAVRIRGRNTKPQCIAATTMEICLNGCLRRRGTLS